MCAIATYVIALCWKSGFNRRREEVKIVNNIKFPCEGFSEGSLEKNQVVSSSVFWSQEIIDNLDVGIIAVDRNNIITVCNAFADNF